MVDTTEDIPNALRWHRHIEGGRCVVCQRLNGGIQSTLRSTNQQESSPSPSISPPSTSTRDKGVQAQNSLDVQRPDSQTLGSMADTQQNEDTSRTSLEEHTAASSPGSIPSSTNLEPSRVPLSGEDDDILSLIDEMYAGDGDEPGAEGEGIADEGETQRGVTAHGSEVQASVSTLSALEAQSPVSENIARSTDTGSSCPLGESSQVIERELERNLQRELQGEHSKNHDKHSWNREDYSESPEECSEEYDEMRDSIYSAYIVAGDGAEEEFDKSRNDIASAYSGEEGEPVQERVSRTEEDDTFYSNLTDEALAACDEYFQTRHESVAQNDRTSEQAPEDFYRDAGADKRHSGYSSHYSRAFDPDGRHSRMAVTAGDAGAGAQETIQEQCDAFIPTVGGFGSVRGDVEEAYVGIGGNPRGNIEGNVDNDARDSFSHAGNVGLSRRETVQEEHDGFSQAVEGHGVVGYNRARPYISAGGNMIYVSQDPGSADATVRDQTEFRYGDCSQGMDWNGGAIDEIEEAHGGFGINIEDVHGAPADKIEEGNAGTQHVRPDIQNSRTSLGAASTVTGHSHTQSIKERAVQATLDFLREHGHDMPRMEDHPALRVSICNSKGSYPD